MTSNYQKDGVEYSLVTSPQYRDSGALRIISTNQIITGEWYEAKALNNQNHQEYRFIWHPKGNNDYGINSNPDEIHLEADVQEIP